MANPTYMGLHYIGKPAFIEQCEPIVSKNEFGLDVSVRKFRGATYLLAAFLAGLHQGQQGGIGGGGSAVVQNTPTGSPAGGGVTVSPASSQLYLQRWETNDDNRGFSTVYLYLKGLLSGKIPDPMFSTDTATKTVTVTKPGPTTFDILYYAQTNTYRYIANSLTAPLPKGLTVSAPTIINSVFTNSFGQRQAGVPSDISLQAIIERDQRNQVYGTPYYECEAVVAGVISI